MLEGWAALLTALAAVGGMVWQGAKTRAELRAMRRSTGKAVAQAARQVEDVSKELQPNHGSSTRDAITRIEGQVAKAIELSSTVQRDQAALQGDLTGLRQELRGDREATRQVRVDVTQLRGDVGSLRDALMAHMDKGWETEKGERVRPPVVVPTHLARL